MAVQRSRSQPATVFAAVGTVHSEASRVRGQDEGSLQQPDGGRGRTKANTAKGRARARVHRAADEVLATGDRFGEDSAKEQGDGEFEESHLVSARRHGSPMMRGQFKDLASRRPGSKRVVYRSVSV